MSLPNIKNIVGKGFHIEDRLIIDYDVLGEVVGILKKIPNRIVLTQGVYDMFHVGHGRYLREAKSFGDILIVGVDTDELTRQRKGPSRPFDAFEERVEVLADCRAVNIITPRNVGDDPNRLIEVVRPDVLVVSQTTTDFLKDSLEKCRKFCGEIAMLEAQAATSTTAKVRRLQIEGAGALAQEITAVVNKHLYGSADDGSQE